MFEALCVDARLRRQLAKRLRAEHQSLLAIDRDAIPIPVQGDDALVGQVRGGGLGAGGFVQHGEADAPALLVGRLRQHRVGHHLIDIALSLAVHEDQPGRRHHVEILFEAGGDEGQTPVVPCEARSARPTEFETVADAGLRRDAPGQVAVG